MNLYRIILMLVVILFSACRYEDGPLISFIAFDNRIENRWQVERFMQNDVDLTRQWKDNYDWIFHFYCQNGCSEGISMGCGIDMTLVPEDIYPDSASAKNYEAIFRFENNYKILVLTYHFLIYDNHGDPETVCNECGMYPFISSTQIYFTITKLTEKKLWLRHTSASGDEYEIHLKE